MLERLERRSRESSAPSAYLAPVYGTGSEEQLKPELNHPSGSCSGDAAECPACDGLSRITKIDLVKHVEEFRPELQPIPLGERDILDDREVGV